MALLRFLYTLYAYGVGVPVIGLFLLLEFLLAYRYHARTHRYFVINRFCCILLYRVLLLRATVHGREHLPVKCGSIYISNHQSLIDIPLIYQLIPEPFSFIFKKELLRVPLFGKHLQHHDHIAIDRASPMDLEVLEQKIIAFLAQGQHVAIFPEGTRSTTGQLQGFKRGAFRLALLSGAPLVPIYIHGSGKFKPKNRSSAWPVRVQVFVGPPLPVEKLSKNDPTLRQRSIELTQQAEDLLRQMETQAQSSA